MKLNKISHIIISLFIVFSYSHGKVLDLESYESIYELCVKCL